MKYFYYSLAGLFFAAVIIVAGVVYLFYHYGRDLPDHRQLAAYEPAIMTRVHAGDGRLVAEYATEKRLFVPISAMPKRVIDVFLSAEDKIFMTISVLTRSASPVRLFKILAILVPLSVWSVLRPSPSRSPKIFC